MAMDILPLSVLDCAPQCGDAKVGENFIAPGLANSLETFYAKASSVDRQRCLQLLNTIDANHTTIPHQITPSYLDPRRPKRPKTAMASLNTDGAIHNVYSTKYGREYVEKRSNSTSAHRPSTSHDSYQYPHELSGPVGKTTYDQEYAKKMLTTATPIRSGSASGDRKNNPHPHASFMHWRLPSHVEKDCSSYAPPITDEDLDRFCRGHLRSTYQYDFTGLPQGYKPPTANNLPSDWRSNLQYSLQSNMRSAYRTPQNEQPQFVNNSTRYGCNTNKLKPAVGCVPNSSDRYLHITPNTTYDREYIPRAKLDKNRRCSAYGTQAMKNYHNATNDRERDLVSRMIRTSQAFENRSSSSDGCRRSPGYNIGKPSSPNLSWTSTWAGPN